MGILIVSALMMTAGAEAPQYTLEPVGIDFMYLPEYLTPLVEGVLTEEAGALAGQPNSLGITFGCHYWKADIPVEDKNLWIQEKLSSVMPPDMMEDLYISSPSWAEGSMEAGVPSRLSLGLMSLINFTVSPENGPAGRGRAYGIFRNGYSILLVTYGPSSENPQNDLAQVVGMAVLSD